MKLAPGGRDLAVFMFSGHGVVVGEGDGAEFYLLPHGADVEQPLAHPGQRHLGHRPATGARRASPTIGRVLVLLDTCSSGAAMTGDGRAAGRRRRDRPPLAGRQATSPCSPPPARPRCRARTRNGATAPSPRRCSRRWARTATPTASGMISVERARRLHRASPAGVDRQHADAGDRDPLHRRSLFQRAVRSSSRWKC